MNLNLWMEGDEVDSQSKLDLDSTKNKQASYHG